MKSLIAVIASLLVLLVSGWAGWRGAGGLPPLGAFLDPFNGVWAVARNAELRDAASARIPGLSGPVSVRYDDRAVPHIVAGTEADAYAALGYVLARDRLFQMELQTRATAGTLTELVGRAALEQDRSQRRLGLAATADSAFLRLDPESPTVRALTAYARGVNAYIGGLRKADLPLEYRLLNATPMPWQLVYSLYLIRRMGWTLSYQRDEMRLRRVAALVGEPAARALFPVNSPVQEPIEPGRGPYPRYDFTPIPAPRPGGPAPAPAAGSYPPEEEAVGSNNWAVVPGRSATGYALLAGDPHLELTLPSIWYEAHLQVTGPGELDVYGVTIPGAPGIVVGFNRDVAWSLTNTEADALDLFAERLDNPRQPTRYFLDGQWAPLKHSIQRYRGRDGGVLAVDTVFFTHRGPVTFDGNIGYSVRWTVLETTGELAAIGAGARAASADDWLDATASFGAPAQNMLVADRHGTIAVRSTGLLPRRAGNGSGLVVRDGTSRSGDWQGYWPVARYPGARNPAQGFLASANQQPRDPRTDSTYLGADWGAPWRAMRINALLRADSSVTLDDMRRWQTDPASARADAFMPFLLRAAEPDAGERAAASAGLVTGTGAAGEAAVLLAQWDRTYTRMNERAVLFEAVMDQLALLVWDEMDDGSGRRIATPRDVLLLALMNQPGSVWWDRRETAEREDRDAVIRDALEAGLRQTRRRFGEPEKGGWRWEVIQHANIRHLLGIDAFSALAVPVQGGPGTLSPSSGDGSDGASWRMVVELGPQVRAWGIYPGGQSGNPVSSRYADRVQRWAAGELDTLRFAPAGVETSPPTIATLELLPDGR